jgi:hypothetical protein
MEQVFRADTMFDGLGIETVAIDADGSELAILWGANQLLQGVRFVLIETHPVGERPSLETEVAEHAPSRQFSVVNRSVDRNCC